MTPTPAPTLIEIISQVCTGSLVCWLIFVVGFVWFAFSPPKQVTDFYEHIRKDTHDRLRK